MKFRKFNLIMPQYFRFVTATLKLLLFVPFYDGKNQYGINLYFLISPDSGTTTLYLPPLG